MREIEFPLTCLLGLLLLPWFGAALCRRLDVLSPVLLFTICIFVGYVLPIPAFLVGNDPVTLYWTNVYGDFERSLERALWQVVIGVFGFYLGYAVMRDLVPGAQTVAVSYGRPRWRNGLLRIIGLTYTTVGLSLFAVGVAIIGGPTVLVSGLWSRLSLFSGLNYFFSAINLLLIVSLIWWVRDLSEARLPGALFWLYTVFAVVLAALQGSKSILFVFVLAMVLIYHTLQRRVSLLRLALLGTPFVLLLSAYTIYVREYVPLGELRTLNLSESWPMLLWQLVINEFAGNFIQLQALTLVIDRVPEVLDFQYGRTLLALLTIAIPSALYPDKYLTAPGVFTLTIDPDRWVKEGTTLPPGLIGEMYMNFGSAGVLLGLIVFGAAFGWMRRVARMRARDPLIITLYSLAVAMMAHYVRGEAVSPTVLLLIFALPTVTALSLVVVRHPAGPMGGNKTAGAAHVEPFPG